MGWEIIVILYVTLIIVGVMVFWIIGARVFKIKDVINLQKEILDELKKINSKE